MAKLLDGTRIYGSANIDNNLIVNTMNVVPTIVAAFGQANTANTTSVASFAQANSANLIANLAYDKANTANVFATSAFSAQNVTSEVANAAFNKANTANITADAAFARANAANLIANLAYDKANTANVIASGAYDKANTANITADASFARANAANLIANLAYDKANTANVIASGAYDKANIANITADSAFARANAANLVANLAYDKANTANITADAAFARANAANLIANLAYDKANTANVIASGAYDKANTANITACAAFAQANTANTTSVAAFAKANAAFPSTGGTVSGDVFISGNLTVVGNSTVFNVSSLVVNDPLIFLANNNYSSDLVDIGFVGHYNDGVNAHTGFIRDATSKEYFIFNGYTLEVFANDIINIAHPSFALTNINANYYKGNLIANTVVIAISSTVAGVNIVPTLSSAFDKANTANITADAAFARANAANLIANLAFDKANTANVFAVAAFDRANTANITADAAFARANAANLIANLAFDKANTANVIASASFDRANSANITADAAFARANAANLIANLAFDKANTANVFAVAAFGRANTANITADASFARANAANLIANLAFDRANTANVTACAAFAAANTMVMKAGNTMTGNLVFSAANITFLSSATSFSNLGIYFSNTPTVGIESAIYSNAANILVFATQKLERVRIDAGGRLNVGTIDIVQFSTAAYDTSNAAFARANAANLIANLAYDRANTANVTACAAFTQANTANTTAVAAFAKANLAAPIASPTFTGTVTAPSPVILLKQLDPSEGGEIDFEKSSASSISGNLIVDLYNDRFRIFEATGTNRGFFLDITKGNTGVTGEILHTNNWFNFISTSGSTDLSGVVFKVGNTMTGNLVMSGANITFATVSNSGIYWGSNSFIYSPAANTLVFGTSSSEDMRIDSGGNIGIGTSSPTNKLEVHDQTNAGFLLSQFNDTDGAVIRARRYRGTIASPSSVLASDVLLGLRAFGYTNASAMSSVSASIDLVASENFTSTALGSFIRFRTTGTGSTVSVDRVRIDSSGNVGIGTTAPAATLDVVGSFSDAQANTLSQTLTDAASIAWDASLGRVAVVTLGGARSLANATNLRVGTYILRVQQNTSGGSTLTFGRQYKFTANVAPTLTSAANSVDIFSFVSDGTNMYGAMIPDVRS